MLDFHERRKLKALLYSKPAAAVLIGIAILLSSSVYERFTREREVALRRHELEAKLLDLKGQAAALEAEVERLRSDRGIEEELRDRFEIAKSGEQVIVIVGGEQGTTASATAEVSKEGGFFQSAKQFLTE